MALEFEALQNKGTWSLDPLPKENMLLAVNDSVWVKKNWWHNRKIQSPFSSKGFDQQSGMESFYLTMPKSNMLS